MNVLAASKCRWCGRDIEYVEGIGWMHSSFSPVKKACDKPEPPGVFPVPVEE